MKEKQQNDDNWYDVIIRDNTPPVITVVDADSSSVSEVILTSPLDDVQSAGFGLTEKQVGCLKIQRVL